MTDRGFSLVELVVTMAVVGILGVAIARIMINDSAFVGRQEAQLTARQTARAAMTLMQTEFQRVSDRAVVAAGDDSIEVRIPYAFGVLCAFTGTGTVASAMPVDSAAWANAAADGVAWRQANGTYAYRAGVTAGTSTDVTTCNADSVRVVPNGKLLNITGAFIADPGTIFYLYQQVKYRFATSLAMPGRIGLFRSTTSTSEQELLAPFDASAQFDFLVGSTLAVQDQPPAVLDSLMGIVLRLVAQSDATPLGAPAPQTFDLSLRVRFQNRAM